jgi:hypothetical protein
VETLRTQALADDGHQGSLRPAPAFKQPLRVIAALSELGDPQFDGAHSGVEVAIAIAVVTVHLIVAPFSIRGATESVSFCGHEVLGERTHHLPKQIDVCFLQLLAQPGQGVHPCLDHCVLLGYGT